jgi:hypothetical protein
VLVHSHSSLLDLRGSFPQFPLGPVETKPLHLVVDCCVVSILSCPFVLAAQFVVGFTIWKQVLPPSFCAILPCVLLLSLLLAIDHSL